MKEHSRPVTGIGVVLPGLADLLSQLEDADLVTRDFDRRYSDVLYLGVGDPTVDIGTALRLAGFYNIEVRPGFCYSTARARFEYPGSGAVIERGTVQEAVCECVLAVAEMGILRRNLEYRLEVWEESP